MRFRDKGCIYWNGGLDSDGYGRIYVYFDDRMPRKSRVHRLFYSLHHFQSIDLPSRNDLGCKIEVFHLCHEPRCCNVAHLNLETHQINMSFLHEDWTHQVQGCDGDGEQWALPRCFVSPLTGSNISVVRISNYLFKRYISGQGCE